MIKKIIVFLNQLLISLSLITLILLSLFFQTLGNKDYLLSILQKNNYSEQIYQFSISKVEGEIVSLGLSKEKIEKIYTKEKVEKDINNVILSFYQNKEIKIDTTSITDNLDNMITKKVQENNRSITLDEQQAIDKLKTQVATLYETNILYSKKYLSQIQKIFLKIFSLRKVFILSNTTIFLILTILLFLLTKKKSYFSKSFGIATLTTSFVFLLIKFFFQSKFQKIVIFSPCFSKVIVSIINDIFQKMTVSAIILGIFSLLLIILGVNKAVNKKG